MRITIVSLAAVMLIASSASAGIVFSGTTLTYGAPGDLGNAASIQQNTTSPFVQLATVFTSLASTSGPALTDLATFSALPGVQVVGFNDVTANNSSPVTTIVANYDGTNNITFSAPTVQFLYGYSNVGGGNRLAFSGPSINSDVRMQGAAGTTPGDANTLNQFLNLSVAVTDPTKGMTAFGACFSFRNDQGGQGTFADAVIYLSDGITPSTQVATIPAVQIPANGGTNHDQVWFGYQAPAGLTITGIVLGFEPGNTNNNPGMDDLSFVVATPEPATMSMLVLGGIGMIGGVIRRRRKVA